MAQRSGSARRGGTRSLQQAASTIFVLTTLLPFLIFVWILYTLDAMQSLRVQLGLVLALIVSILGFSVLRNVMNHTSEVLRLLMRIEGGDDAPDVAAREAVAPAGRRAAPASRDGAGKAHSARATPKSAGADAAPAVGEIQEFQAASALIAHKWKRQADPLIGKSVIVVTVGGEHEQGTVSRTTDDGLILETEGSEFGVLWRFVASIKPAPTPEPSASTGT